MQLLDSYPLPPGCCAFCRGNATPLIDVGLNTDDLPVEMGVEQSGWVYVCVQCVKHMGHMVGMIDADRAKNLAVAANEAEMIAAGLRSRLTATENALVALQAAGYTPANPEVARAAH